LGAKKTDGYGKLKWRGRVILAHRATWEVERGPIPEGLDVLHRCDNPPCRNIEHLFLGTSADNVADMDAKGRRRCLAGETNPFAKLTDATVREIRAIPFEVPQHVVAAMYGIHQRTVGRIRSRQRWAHL
jgi:HNH endonuclease